jgi:hypothetical protein
MQASNAVTELEEAQALGHASVEEMIAADANAVLHAQHVAVARAYQSSAHAIQRKTEAASKHGLTPDQISWVEPPFDAPVRITAADVVAARDAGFQVQLGTAEHRLDLIGRWWWTLSQPGWQSVESSAGNFATKAEAWADVVRALRDDPSLGSPAKAAEEPRLWVAMVEHVECPGARLAVFFQREEPVDAEIFARYAATTKPTELDIAGLFDLTFDASVDPGTARALMTYANAQVEGDYGAISPPAVGDETLGWLNPGQRAILEKYARGQFSYLACSKSEEEFRSSVARCGDGVLKFLMTELSSAEDCSSGEQASARIEIAIAQLQSVLGAVQDIPEWMPNDGHDQAMNAGC